MSKVKDGLYFKIILFDSNIFTHFHQITGPINEETRKTLARSTQMLTSSPEKLTSSDITSAAQIINAVLASNTTITEVMIYYSTYGHSTVHLGSKYSRGLKSMIFKHTKAEIN